MNIRSIKQTVTGIHTQDGAGVKLVRVLSKPNIYDFDPFLMLDAFDSKNKEDYIKGFPWHPHRGIETITYLIHGLLEHGDSLGNKGLIEDGGSQWMTAGSGIVHQEMPQPCPHVLGVQLWLNLPQKDKMTKPQYRDIIDEKIPKIEKEGCVVKVISGEYEGTTGAIVPDYVPLTFLDVKLDKNANFNFNSNPNETLFVYIVLGQAIFDESKRICQAKEALLFSHGEMLQVSTNNQEVQFLVFMAPSLKEPIAWGGPIVMNTDEELRFAFKELREGTFIK